jgi:hypothetical protein
LTLLVDWVENDTRPEKAMLRGSAA